MPVRNFSLLYLILFTFGIKLRALNESFYIISKTIFNFTHNALLQSDLDLASTRKPGFPSSRKRDFHLQPALPFYSSVNWNASWVSDSERREILTNPELEIRHGGTVPEQQAKALRFYDAINTTLLLVLCHVHYLLDRQLAELTQNRTAALHSATFCPASPPFLC